MRPFIVIFIAMSAAVLTAGCQAPAESSAVKSGSAYMNSNNKQPAPTTQPGNVVNAANPGAALTSCGNQVGNDVMKKATADCLATGMFYDRQYVDPNTKMIVGQCTTMPVAQMPCNMTDVKNVMSSNDSKTLDAYLADANSLQGYVIDQILDCSSTAAAGFSGCQLPGATANVKVIRLYMAKQVSSQIMTKTLLVALPATK